MERILFINFRLFKINMEMFSYVPIPTGDDEWQLVKIIPANITDEVNNVDEEKEISQITVVNISPTYLRNNNNQEYIERQINQDSPFGIIHNLTTTHKNKLPNKRVLAGFHQ
jgi:hypothetical protein